MASRRVIKGFLKDTEKLSGLTRRAMKTIKERFVEDVDVSNVERPPVLNAFLEPILTKMREVRTSLDAGEPVLEEALQGLDDGQLRSLQQLFSSKRSGTYSEEWLVQSAFIMFKEVDTLQRSIQHLHFVKNELIETFVSAYGKSFHEKKGGDVAFANQKFKDKVQEIINYRDAVRRTLERANVPAPAPDTSGEGQCIVM